MDPYVKTTWQNGTTPLNAQNLTHIEEGIYNCTNEVISIENNTLPELASDITELSSAVENLESSIHSYLPLSAGSNHVLTGDLYIYEYICDSGNNNRIGINNLENGISFQLKNGNNYIFDDEENEGGTIATKEYIEERIASIHLYKHTITCDGGTFLYIINTSEDELDTAAKIYDAERISCYAKYNSGDPAVIARIQTYNVRIQSAVMQPTTYTIYADDVLLTPRSDDPTPIF